MSNEKTIMHRHELKVTMISPFFSFSISTYIEYNDLGSSREFNFRNCFVKQE